MTDHFNHWLIGIILLLLMINGLLFDSLNLGKTDIPEHSDLIVVFAGSEGRLEKAAELYKLGYADKVLLTPANGESNPQAAVASGIPASALILDRQATSTYNNAVVTLDVMKKNGYKKALVVTSDYHIRRSRFILNRLNEDGYEISIVGALNTKEQQWTERSNANAIWWSEFRKLMGYRLGLYQWIDE